MAKIANWAGAARKRKRSAVRSQRSGKKSARKKNTPTALASQKVDATPAQPLPSEKERAQADQRDVLDNADMEAITSEMCREIDDAVLLINCLMPLKRMAHVVDACACPPDPANNPPDWCMLVHSRMWKQLENVIARINDAIGLRLKRVTEIIGAQHLTEEEWQQT